ncbi:MAG: NADP-dependent oxidoreductase [Leptospiraceae bacterium]|nr:NADP-dependent oxidoreductase [Leptospiraceae bacterium]
MKASLIRKYGGNEVIEYVEDFPKPVIDNDEVLIEMRAASVNPIDWKVMKGDVKIMMDYKMPHILGNDGAGVVTQIGVNVNKFKVGDEVYFRPGKKKITGTFAEFCVVNHEEAALKPKNLSFEEAAGIPLVGLTSWQALFDLGNLQKGQKVLIHAGSGGVGNIAIQLAKNAGAEVATTTSTTNIELVKSLGADVIIDYKKENFWELLKDYDLVFDTMGGKSREDSYKVLKPGGILISISGIPTPDYADKFGLNPFIKTLFYLLNIKNSSLAKKHKVNYKYLFMNASGEQLSKITKLIEDNKVKPLVDKVFPLKDVKEAFSYQQTGRVKGKIIIQIK